MTILDGGTEVLVDKFGPNVEGKVDVLAEMQSIMRIYDLNEEDLFWKWEAYCIKMEKENLQLSVDTVRELKSEIQRQLEAENRKSKTSHTPANMVKARSSPADRLTPRTPASLKRKAFNGSATPTPTAQVRRQQLQQSSPATPVSLSSPLPLPKSTPFDDRREAGKIIETLNPQLSLDGVAEPLSEPRSKLAANVDLKKYKFRTMFQKLSETSEYLDERIEMFIDIIKDHYEIPFEQFGNPSNVTQTEIIAVGRIISESQDGGRMNASSVILESCRSITAGSRVRLQLDNVKDYSLFPGQIVAVKGTNLSGERFVVKEFLELPLLPFAGTSREILQEFADKEETRPINIIHASGPYTPSDNLDFQPFKALVKKANEVNPDYLILAGPFIDCEHPMVANGDFILEVSDGTTLDLFKEKISRELALVNTGTIVLLIPHLRDAVTEHVAYPQGPFSRSALDLPKNVRCLSNPCLFSINEITIGVTTNDIIYDLSREELSFGSYAKQDMSSRLTRHLLSQRHFYPLFPGHGTEKDRNLFGQTISSNLDVSYLGLAELSQATPDIMLLPGLGRFYAKVVGGVISINPGPSCKKMGYGAYAHIKVNPPVLSEDAKAEGTEDAYLHKIWGRAQIDIVKI